MLAMTKPSPLALPLPLLLLLTLSTTTVAAAESTYNSTISDLRKQLPPCSLECIAQKSEELGCALTDLTCQCKQLQALTRSAAPCLAKGDCELEEITKAASVSAKMCAADMEEKGYTIGDGEASTSSGGDNDDGPAPTTESADGDGDDGGNDSSAARKTSSRPWVGVLSAAIAAAAATLL